MNESQFDDDPFLAVSDESESEKAIQGIDAFLNAPSTVVVQSESKSQNQKNQPTSPSSPKKSSTGFDSSLLDMPSFDSAEDSENIILGLNQVIPNRVNDNTKSPQNENNTNPSTPNLDKKKKLKRSPYPKNNMISNNDLINAFLHSDDKDNENKEKDLTIQTHTKDETKDKIKDENSNLKKQEKKSPKKSPKKIENSKKKLDFLDTLDLNLDSTEIESNSLKNDENLIISPSKTPPSNNNKSSTFLYISPKSPIENFEYSFMRYLDDVSNDMRARFIDDLQAVVSQSFDIQNDIQNFIFNLNQDIRNIILESSSSLNQENFQAEYETDYIFDTFNNLSSSLKLPHLSNSENEFDFTQNNFKFNFGVSSDKVMDLNSVSINSNLIQSLKSSFLTNSKSIISDLQRNINELCNLRSDFKISEKARYQDIFKNKVRMRSELEERERAIALEHEYINRKLENLKSRAEIEIYDESISKEYGKPTFSEEINDDIEHFIENLKKTDLKKRNFPLTSFSKETKSNTDEIIFLNSKIISKAGMISRSLSLSNNSSQIQTAMLNNSIMHAPKNDSPSLGYNNSDFFPAQQNLLDQQQTDLICSSNPIVLEARERLKNAKQIRERQIAEVNEIMSEIQ